MGSTGLLFVIGLCGSFVFDYLKLPGGAITGAMVAVILFKTFGSISVLSVPHWVSFLAYGCVGVIVGNMYNPEMLVIIRNTWPVLMLSTSIILAAGCLCAVVVARWGGLSMSSAYLATSPGGFNAVVAFSGNLGEDAPIVMVYHLLRIYIIVLCAPLIIKFANLFTK